MLLQEFEKHHMKISTAKLGEIFNKNANNLLKLPIFRRLKHHHSQISAEKIIKTVCLCPHNACAWVCLGKA